MHIENRTSVPRAAMFMQQPIQRQVVEDTGEGYMEMLFTDRLLLSPEARALLERLREGMKGRAQAASPGGGIDYLDMLLQGLTPGLFSLAQDLLGDHVAGERCMEGPDDPADPHAMLPLEEGCEALSVQAEGELPEALADSTSPEVSSEEGSPPSTDNFLLVLRILLFALRFVH